MNDAPLHSRLHDARGQFQASVPIGRLDGPEMLLGSETCSNSKKKGVLVAKADTEEPKFHE